MKEGVGSPLTQQQEGMSATATTTMTSNATPTRPPSKDIYVLESSPTPSPQHRLRRADSSPSRNRAISPFAPLDRPKMRNKAKDILINGVNPHSEIQAVSKSAATSPVSKSAATSPISKSAATSPSSISSNSSSTKKLGSILRVKITHHTPVHKKRVSTLRNPTSAKSPPNSNNSKSSRPPPTPKIQQAVDFPTVPHSPKSPSSPGLSLPNSQSITQSPPASPSREQPRLPRLSTMSMAGVRKADSPRKLAQLEEIHWKAQQQGKHMDWSSGRGPKKQLSNAGRPSPMGMSQRGYSAPMSISPRARAGPQAGLRLNVPQLHTQSQRNFNDSRDMEVVGVGMKVPGAGGDNSATSTITTRPSMAVQAASADDADGDDQYQEDEASGMGILSWLSAQKEKWQKQALEEQVQEQRRILLEETARELAAKNRRRAARKQKRKQRKSGQVISRLDMPVRTLGDNEAYQSITQQFKDNGTNGGGGAHEHPTIGLTICGGSYVDDEDEDYIIENEDIDGTGDDVRNDESYDSDTTDTDSAPLSPLGTESSEKLGLSDDFRIGTPHNTHAGGIAVQLEFSRHQRKKKKKKRLIKIQEEKNDAVEETVPFILSLEQMTAIAEKGLPPSVVFSKWTRLYSLQRDGDSFESAFLKKVDRHEKTLLVIQTTNHEVFGAYVNSPWESQGAMLGSNHFYGSAQACLFSIDTTASSDDREDHDGDGVVIYKWSGKNRYVQVCNLQHKLLAMGGGGKEGEFGLCVEDDFRIGSTGRCDTFDNMPLCKATDGQFEILNVECYGFLSGFC